MQRIALLCVGKLKTPWIIEGCADYVRRLRGHVQLEVTEIASSREKDPARQREEESKRLLEAIERRGGAVWVLDEAGKGMTSRQFAEALGRLRDRGELVTFVLGSAYGLTDAVRKRATVRLKLGDMTLPHELCRLVFLEQLYRAQEIQRGSGYHH